MRSTLRATCAALLLGLPLIACDDGPAERAGERLDRAAERIQDAIDPPKGPLERAGREIDRAMDRVTN